MRIQIRSKDGGAGTVTETKTEKENRDRRDRRDRRMRTPVVLEKAYHGSVLSSTSLGIKENKKEKLQSYTHGGKEIKRFPEPNKKAMKNHPEILIDPAEGWWPSQYASFKLSKKIDILWIQHIIPDMDNPSIWLWRDRKYRVLRVPKDRRERIKKLLNREGLWYSRTTNLWKRRCNFDAIQAQRGDELREWEGEREEEHGK